MRVMRRRRERINKMFGVFIVVSISVSCILAKSKSASFNRESHAEAKEIYYNSVEYKESSEVPTETSNVNLIQSNLSKSSIAIDTALFNITQIKLNTEIYSTCEQIITPGHISHCFGSSNTELFNSYKNTVTPLVPIALSLNEHGGVKDSRYTWSPAIYSRVLNQSGMDMTNATVDDIDSDTYLSLGLDRYLSCGDNCTVSESYHKHVGGGLNDNDSLGALQIRRHYVEASDGATVYDCGASVYDLMKWKDCVEYFFHNQGSTFSSTSSWAKDYAISNTYELVGIIGAIHNTGSGFINTSSKYNNGGSYWLNAESVVNYCNALTTESNLVKLNKYVDSWYKDKVLNDPQGDYALAGEYCAGSDINKLLSDLGINKYDYASSWAHKQNYPLKAILNYMALERLYGISKSTQEVVISE